MCECGIQVIVTLPSGTQVFTRVFAVDRWHNIVSAHQEVVDIPIELRRALYKQARTALYHYLFSEEE